MQEERSGIEGKKGEREREREGREHESDVARLAYLATKIMKRSYPSVTARDLLSSPRKVPLRFRLEEESVLLFKNRRLAPRRFFAASISLSLRAL